VTSHIDQVNTVHPLDLEQFIVSRSFLASCDRTQMRNLVNNFLFFSRTWVPLHACARFWCLMKETYARTGASRLCRSCMSSHNCLSPEGGYSDALFDAHVNGVRARTITFFDHGSSGGYPCKQNWSTIQSVQARPGPTGSEGGACDESSDEKRTATTS
jgi:hypothetical protein